mmetsp:Transcript_8924/g.14572  ORF Transcript_8924/g.14572 Transcript_8924/m.14572 type:complete len:93 (-) Transcript_8924:573-851(-)
MWGSIWTHMSASFEDAWLCHRRLLYQSDLESSEFAASRPPVLRICCQKSDLESSEFEVSSQLPRILRICRQVWLMENHIQKNCLKPGMMRAS